MVKVELLLDKLIKGCSNCPVARCLTDNYVCPLRKTIEDKLKALIVKEVRNANVAN